MLICDGLSNNAIAEELVLSLGTVKWYNKQIFAKLNVENRTAAALRARELHLFTAALSPPAPSIHHRHNLPAPLNPFIGRKTELHALLDLIKTTRLITITGPGGIGKTRLALQFARSQFETFPDGVYFVPLASVTNVSSIVFAISEAFQFQFRSGEEPWNQLTEYLRRKAVLLVMDNFEHLCDGAEMLLQLLKNTEKLAMIATSREPLNLYGEVTYPVTGLALDQHEQDGGHGPSDAMELFVKRAQSVHALLNIDSEGWSDVAHICELVEGMPLAIELAATWVDTLRLPEIVDEISAGLDILEAETHGGYQGHHSIRSTFLRSWDQLDAEQQKVFCRIAVFRDGFDRRAGREVASASSPTLKALVSKSLVRFEPGRGRYHLHPLIQQFATEKLHARGETDAALAAHGRYFAAFAEEKWRWIREERQDEAFLQLETDIENIRAAWRYWLQVQDFTPLQKLFHVIWAIYDVRGWDSAGVQLFRQAIDRMEGSADPDAALCIGWLTAVQGLFTIARIGSRKGFDLCLKGVRVLRDLDRRDQLLVPLLGLSKSALHVGDKGMARETAEECLTIAAELGETWGVCKANHLLAVLAISQEDQDRAETLARAALKICSARKDYWLECMLCIEVMATVAILQERYSEAKQWLEQGLKSAASINFIFALRAAYFQLGYVSELTGDHAGAATHWYRAIAFGDHVMGRLSLLATTGFFGNATSGDYGVKLAEAASKKD